MKTKFPSKGMPGNQIFDEIKGMKSGDSNWVNGRLFSLVFNAGEEIKDFSEKAFTIFINENSLSPFNFPSLLKMENEVVGMMIDLLGGDNHTAGSFTTGGTESLMVVIKTARDYARYHKPHIQEPELIMPLSAHPSINKAAHYLGIKTVIIPTDNNSEIDLVALRKAINTNTIMIIGSAPSYPHGIIDPIEEMGKIALEQQIWFHVDACIGGMILPFIKKAGYVLPNFDLNVPGVWSISADIHKYGFVPKGASVILYRDAELRKYQFYIYVDWPGGIYATPSMAGSRSGGPLAASWGIIKFLGQEGFIKLADTAMKTSQKLQEGVRETPGLYVIGKPQATLFAIASDSVNIYTLGDKMKSKCWHLDYQQKPPSLHMTVMPGHAQIIRSFIADLHETAEEIIRSKEKNASGEGALYEMLASMPDRQMAKDLTCGFLGDMFKAE